MKNQLHLLWRAGFGPDLKSPLGKNMEPASVLFNDMLKESGKSSDRFNEADFLRDEFMPGQWRNKSLQEMTREQKTTLRIKSREVFQQLNRRWIHEMVNSEAQLREKIALFWHGHFACRINNAYFQQELLNVIRKNALGNFRDLLSAVSGSPAMISFLNNQQNRKKHPNENFARELLELFTMGRGNYSEEDVKEAARAFTGWGFDAGGNFVFRQIMHDGGQKTILGKKGNFSGDDVLKIILEKKQTAHFISRKLVIYLAGMEPDESILQKLAENFYQQDYNISVLLSDILTSSWFYEEKFIGSKIKSPVDWMVGIQRTLVIEDSPYDWQLLMQKLLGQVLFFPPNVAGWPGGENWIDSSTLMYRLRWPLLLGQPVDILGSPKVDDDVQMGIAVEGRLKNAMVLRKNAPQNMMMNVNWSEFARLFDGVSKDQLTTFIKSKILVTGGPGMDLLKRHINGQSRDSFIRTLTSRLMSTPEYQLC